MMSGNLPQGPWLNLGLALIAALGLQMTLVFSVRQSSQPERVEIPPEPMEVELLIPPMAPSPAVRQPSALSPPRTATPTPPKPVPKLESEPEHKETSKPTLKPAPQATREPEPVTRPEPIPPAESRPAPAVLSSAPAASVPMASPVPTGAAPSPSSGSETVGAKPDYLSNPPPDYPMLARRRGWRGTVLLKVRVSASGSPREIRLIKGSGHDMLDTAAQDAVQGWRFVPARKSGEPVESWVEIPVRFELNA